MSIKSNLIMRQQLTEQLGARDQHAARAQEHRSSNAPEPTLPERLLIAAPAFSDEARAALVETERVRTGEHGLEVLTLHGWYPATEWALRQAVDLIPERYTFADEATHETVAARMVNRRRDSLGRPVDE